MHQGVRGKGAAFKGGLRTLGQERASEIVGYLAISVRGLGPTLPWQVDNGQMEPDPPELSLTCHLFALWEAARHYEIGDQLR